MKVMDLKEEYRPRERAIKYGIEVLRNDELIAILLRSGYKGKSAIELADEIISLRKKLNGLTNLTFEELMSIKGIKQAKALEILACFELSRRIAYDSLDEKISINSPQSLIRWLNAQIGYLEQEHFMILFLNNQNEIITYKDMFCGLENSCNISVKEVYTQALRISSSKILLVHNHPSGNIEPSIEDIHVTENFIRAGKLCGIECLDHIIVGQNRYFSFQEKQMIAS
ncbi:MAG: DNA repair protein RadC [Traorella sp.]